MYKVIGVLCAVAIVTALPAEDTRATSRNAINTDDNVMANIYNDCVRKDSVSCVKYKLFNFVDKFMDRTDTFALTEGVTVVKTGEIATDGAPRALNTDEPIESLVMDRVQDFLQTHTIKVELKGEDIVKAVSQTGRALEDVQENLLDDENDASAEGRGKKKKAAKILGPLVMLIALKAAALLPLLLGAIALIAGKALLIGKIALVLSAIIGLKKLLSQEKHVTYEVVAHPHHSSSHTSSHGDAYSAGAVDTASYSSGGYSGSSGHGGWGRSIDAQDLAYKSQKPTQ